MTDGDSRRPSRIGPTSRRDVLSTLLGVGAMGAVGFDDTVGVSRAVEPGEDAHSHATDLVPTDRATHTATGSGNWTDPDVWDNGVPDADARVHIPSGTAVTLADTTDRLHWLRVDGTYRVDPGSDSHLRVETVVTTEASRFEVGTAESRVGPDVTATTTFLDRGPIDTDYDPGRRSRGLLTVGEVAIHGTEKTEWTELAAFPTSGDDRLELASAPEGWQPGDRVVVAPVDDPDTDEVKAVTGIDGSTVSMASGLDHDHVPPKDDLPVHVANLSRSVRFQSESTDVPRRGHLMFMTSEGVVVENAGLYDLGRTDKSKPFTNPHIDDPAGTNPKARYALHFHVTGADRSKEPHEVRGCAVDGSPGWGFVNHHSYAHITDCVSYDVLGAGFVTEAGDEQGSFERNIAIKSEGSGQHVAHRADEGGQTEVTENPIDDFGHSGHGFWMHSPGVVVDDNVAAGHADYGFFYWGMPLNETGVDRGSVMRDGIMIPANYPKEEATFNRNDGRSADVGETDTHVAHGFVTIRSFANNTAYAVGSGVGTRWMKPQRYSGQLRHNKYEDYNRIEGFTAYGIHRDGGHWLTGGNGIGISWSSHCWVKNCRLVGDGNGYGINRGSNLYQIANCMYQDTTVENFAVGIAVSTGPTTIVTNCTLDNERTNVRAPAGTIHKSSMLWLNNNTYRRAERNLWHHYELRTIGFPAFFDYRIVLSQGPGSEPASFAQTHANSGGVRVDDKKIYFDYQRPDTKPMETARQNGRFPGTDSERAVAESMNSSLSHFNFGQARNLPDEVHEIEDNVEALTGKTNTELNEQYGLKGGGEMVPADAERSDFVDHAWETSAAGTNVERGSDVMPPKLPGMVLEDSSYITIDASTTARPDAPVTFTASGSIADAVTFDWAFGDGASATGQTVTHSFESSGKYEVTLTLTDPDGTTTTASQAIVVGREIRVEAPEDRRNSNTRSYGFTVSDTIVKAATTDTVDGATATGHVDGEGHTYIYSGGLEHFWGKGVTVFIDGEAVDPSDHVDTHTILIDETEDIQKTYQFEVSDTLEAGEFYNGGSDSIDGTPVDTSTLGEQPGNPGETESVSAAIDDDDDGTVDDSEILDAIEYWQHGETVPGTDGETVSDSELFELIDRWQFGK